MLYCKPQILFPGQAFNELLQPYSNSALIHETVSPQVDAEIRFLMQMSTSSMPEAACLVWSYTLPFLLKMRVNKCKLGDKRPLLQEFLGILHFKNCCVGFDLPIPPLCDTPSAYPRIHRFIQFFCVLLFPQIMFSKERYLFFSTHIL